MARTTKKKNAKTNRDGSVESYKLVGSFENLRKTLQRDKYGDRLDRPLAYWALPSDRGLPLAFMGRSLRDLLATPFAELSATPGIGQKKIAGLMMLLHRATKDTPPDDPFGLEKAAHGPAPGQIGAGETVFDAAMVSEALWARWQDTVRRHNLGKLKLGRLAPSLENLPTVIWHTPLEEYVDLTLSDIRSLKTYGEKRVRAVLEIFWVVHGTLAQSTHQDHLDIELVPKFVRPVERWLAKALADSRLPDDATVRDHLVAPLLAQIKIDVGRTVWRLSSDRLGMEGRPQSVRYQAKQMGVTRARIYQLLEDCSKVMAVRWPEGEHLLTALIDRYRQEAPDSDAARLLCAATDLFFPKTQEPVRIVASRLKVSPSMSQAAAGPGEPA